MCQLQNIELVEEIEDIILQKIEVFLSKQVSRKNCLIEMLRALLKSLFLWVVIVLDLPGVLLLPRSFRSCISPPVSESKETLLHV